jgi:hypothetical protein
MIKHLAHAIEAFLFGVGTIIVIGSCVANEMRANRNRRSQAESEARIAAAILRPAPLRIHADNLADPAENLASEDIGI